MSQSLSSREAIDVVHNLSTLLDVGLDRAAISALMDLLDAGINPEALASVVTELRREATAAAELREGERDGDATNDSVERNGGGERNTSF
eukprot:CAMPEP_0172500172 /NCGR_PEP_ID=MMETSP1066-20121228/135396_1 /TAXON_ID=671091 /ORGANISM="Coscinodiscus wailesii, Strain CCMP2513" /LENGTH=89 /DNA_ID=CAMNT_0013274275 /DNA_START=92 /DNA_END=361 /DNA_ORIENTATION=+